MNKAFGFIPMEHSTAMLVITIMGSIAIARIVLRAFGIDYEGAVVSGVRALFGGDEY